MNIIVIAWLAVLALSVLVGLWKGTFSRKTAAKAGIVCLGLLLVLDYVSPLQLQVDLNAPRFRIVRHRMIFPDQELEFNWKDIHSWADSPLESPPVFGERMPGGTFAWEMNHRRFESLYEDAIPGISTECLRTNYNVFELTLRFPLLNRGGPLEPATEWGRRSD